MKSKTISLNKFNWVYMGCVNRIKFLEMKTPSLSNNPVSIFDFIMVKLVRISSRIFSDYILISFNTEIWWPKNTILIAPNTHF